MHARRVAARQRLPLPGLHGARRPRRAAVPRPPPPPLRLEPRAVTSFHDARPHRHPRGARAARVDLGARRLDPGAHEPSRRSGTCSTRSRSGGADAPTARSPASSPRSTTRSASGCPYVLLPARRREIGERAVFETRQAAPRLAVHADGPVLHLVVLRPGREAQRPDGRPRGGQPRLPRHAHRRRRPLTRRVVALGARALSADAGAGDLADPLAGVAALAQADALLPQAAVRPGRGRAGSVKR